MATKISFIHLFFGLPGPHLTLEEGTFFGLILQIATKGIELLVLFGTLLSMILNPLACHFNTANCLIGALAPRALDQALRYLGWVICEPLNLANDLLRRSCLEILIRCYLYVAITLPDPGLRRRVCIAKKADGQKDALDSILKGSGIGHVSMPIHLRLLAIVEFSGGHGRPGYLQASGSPAARSKRLQAAHDIPRQNSAKSDRPLPFRPRSSIQKDDDFTEGIAVYGQKQSSQPPLRHPSSSDHMQIILEEVQPPPRAPPPLIPAPLENDSSGEEPRAAVVLETAPCQRDPVLNSRAGLAQQFCSSTSASKTSEGPPHVLSPAAGGEYDDSPAHSLTDGHCHSTSASKFTVPIASHGIRAVPGEPSRGQRKRAPSPQSQSGARKSQGNASSILKSGFGRGVSAGDESFDDDGQNDGEEPDPTPSDDASSNKRQTTQDFRCPVLSANPKLCEGRKCEEWRNVRIQAVTSHVKNYHIKGDKDMENKLKALSKERFKPEERWKRYYLMFSGPEVTLQDSAGAFQIASVLEDLSRLVKGRQQEHAALDLKYKAALRAAEAQVQYLQHQLLQKKAEIDAGFDKEEDALFDRFEKRHSGSTAEQQSFSRNAVTSNMPPMLAEIGGGARATNARGDSDAGADADALTGS